MCFKVGVESNDPSSIRNRFSNQLLNAAHKLGFPARKPTRFGKGSAMTVAVMDGDYRTLDGSARDWAYTLKTLDAASAVLELAVQNYNREGSDREN